MTIIDNTLISLRFWTLTNIFSRVCFTTFTEEEMSLQLNASSAKLATILCVPADRDFVLYVAWPFAFVVTLTVLYLDPVYTFNVMVLPEMAFPLESVSFIDHFVFSYRQLLPLMPLLLQLTFEEPVYLMRYWPQQWWFHLL